MISEPIYQALQKYKDGFYTGPAISQEIRELRNLGYIAPAGYRIKDDPNELSINPTRWKLTLHGASALLEFEQERDRQAKQEKQQRFENKLSVLNALVPLVTFFLGLIVEHYAGLVSFFVSLVSHAVP